MVIRYTLVAREFPKVKEPVTEEVLFRNINNATCQHYTKLKNRINTFANVMKGNIYIHN